MTRLETHYRRRFVPQGEQYRFRAVGREVLFSAQEVASIMAVWRKAWLSPWLWSVLLASVVTLALAGLHLLGQNANSVGLAVIAAMIALAACVGLLLVSWREADGLAIHRAAIGPGRPPRLHLWHLFTIGIALFNFAYPSPTSFFGHWQGWGWGVLLALAVADYVRLLVKAHRKSAPGS